MRYFKFLPTLQLWLSSHITETEHHNKVISIRLLPNYSDKPVHGGCLLQSYKSTSSA